MIQGDISIFLQALSAPEGDPRLEQALSLVGGDHEVDEYDDTGVVEKYLILSDRGVNFLLRDGQLDTVFVYATATASRGIYGGWSTLIEGIGPDSSRDDLLRALGEPVRSTSAYVTYAADPGFVQFEFDGDALTAAVVMRELIGGQGSEQAKPAEGASSVEGEVAVFLRAVDSPMFSPEHLAVIGLTGPATESFDEQRDGVAWQYEHSARSGVTLQFARDVMVAALIRLHSDEGESVYPSPDRLIAGLPLPSSRADVEAHFGKPRQSDDQMDLYLVDDRYLRFDFDADRSSALTIVMPGAHV